MFAAGRPKPSPPNSGERPCRDAAFHETIVITVPFEPSVFSNVNCSIKIGSFFILFICSLCYVLYAMFITFVDNTSVSAKPLSPSIFENSSTHFHTTVVFVLPPFCFPLSIFLNCSYFLWFPGTLYPPTGPDWCHLWSMLVPFLFGFATNATFLL